MIDLIYFDYADKEWKRTTDTQTIKLNECLQELSLYKGESWFYGNYGVDYRGLFNGEVDISAQVLSVIERYRQYFYAIDVESSRDKEAIIYSVIFYFEDGSATGFNVGYTKSKMSSSRYDIKISKRS